MSAGENTLSLKRVDGAPGRAVTHPKKDSQLHMRGDLVPELTSLMNKAMVPEHIHGQHLQSYREADSVSNTVNLLRCCFQQADGQVAFHAQACIRLNFSRAEPHLKIDEGNLLACSLVKHDAPTAALVHQTQLLSLPQPPSSGWSHELAVASLTFLQSNPSAPKIYL